jgi:DNA-binding Lrp family transcriptional regulator
MLYFAISLGISESYLRIRLKELEKLGLVEPFVAGKERGKSVINYRVNVGD